MKARAKVKSLLGTNFEYLWLFGHFMIFTLLYFVVVTAASAAKPLRRLCLFQ